MKEGYIENYGFTVFNKTEKSVFAITNMGLLKYFLLSRSASKYLLCLLKI